MDCLLNINRADIAEESKYGGVMRIQVNSHVNMGLSMSCTSLSTSIRKSTVTSKSPLMSQKSRTEPSAGGKTVVFTQDKRLQENRADNR